MALRTHPSSRPTSGMRRRTFDILVGTGGILLAAVLIVAGSLLAWAYSYVGNEVHSQLAEQDIFFPTRAAFEHATPGSEVEPVMVPYLLKYAGQQLLSGSQAEAYADHFIAYHLQEIGGGKTYSQLSSESRAQPGNAVLASQVQLMFQGNTLRGLLLEAYAFGTLGSIAGWAALAAFVAGFLFVLLGILGLIHSRFVGPDTELLPVREKLPRQTAEEVGPELATA